MMKRFIIFVAAFLFVTPSYAVEIILEADCKYLPEKALAAEELAEYKAGIDVNGDPVVPADLEEPIEALTYPIQIPVEYNALLLLNREIDDFIELKPEVVNIKLYEDGHTEYNGQDISDVVTYACKQNPEEGDLMPNEIEPAAGDTVSEIESGVKFINPTEPKESEE